MTGNHIAEILGNLTRTTGGTFFYGQVKKIHSLEAKAIVEVSTKTGVLESPFLPVFGRKQKHIRAGERVLLIAPEAKIEQGVIFCRNPDPEQDEQNKRLTELEQRMDYVESLAHGH